jgi:CCR4-NOT transcriptional regulation complex NOT5 subunit
VQAPTSGSHATTKTYVDDLTTNNTNNTSTNSSDISSINTTNTTQNTSITNNTNSIDSNLSLINNNTADIGKMKNGLAQVAAMTGVTTAGNGKSHISIALGNYEGTSAIAYGISHHDDENDILYKLQGSSSGNTSSSVFSAGFSF